MNAIINEVNAATIGSVGQTGLDGSLELTDSTAPKAGRKPRRPTPPRVFVALADETRLTVDTATAAHHTGRKPQTLRGWAMNDTAPAGLRPHRLKGRLAWPVKGLLQAGADA